MCSRVVVAIASIFLASCAKTQTPATRAAGSSLLAGARFVDLTHPFDDQTIYWPTEETGFVLSSTHHGQTPGGYFYSSNRLAAPEHGGTHLDAPIHFAAGKSTTDAVALERTIGAAVVIDITAAATRDRDALLQPDDVIAFERQHGPIAAGAIVLVRTGWSSRWPDRAAYLGSAARGDASQLHFPGISEAAARLLVERRVHAVGIDTASIDHGPSRDFMAHRVLLGADIPAFENITNLAELPPRGAVVIALPMKIRGGSGGPLRIIAALPPSDQP